MQEALHAQSLLIAMDIGHALGNSLITFELTDMMYLRHSFGLLDVPIGAVLTLGNHDLAFLKLDDATSSISTLRLGGSIGKLDVNTILELFVFYSIGRFR